MRQESVNDHPSELYQDVLISEHFGLGVAEGVNQLFMLKNRLQLNEPQYH